MGQALENHAARVLSEAGRGVPADAALRDYLRRPGFLDNAARREVSRAVFSVFRWINWLKARDSDQKKVAAALELQARFERDPASFKTEALAARAVPPWLASEMELSAGFVRKLQAEPALWVRPKLEASARVAAALGSVLPPTLPSTLVSTTDLAALRYAGPADLHDTAAFRAGEFEIQDLASQLVGLACAPRPGETWWDACAGEGGKALHLSDLMRNKGLIWATDRSKRRLEVLAKRAARAGVFNYQSAPWNGADKAPFAKPCHGVLVDAPCSGVGTWQRNPHARWTTSPDDVRELAAVQVRLLDLAALSVKPGGRLVYSVCTLTRSETSAVADAFQAAHPQFEAAPLPLSATGESRLFLLPEEIDANGMFVAAWKRVR